VSIELMGLDVAGLKQPHQQERVFMIITIDGPVASGKSNGCARVGAPSRLFYLYSGILFRGLAYVLINPPWLHEGKACRST